MQKVKLSERLKTIADMVTVGNKVADIGCDHGFVSIYLVQNGISPGVIAMDVRKGPLGMAKEHILQAGLQNQIETRLSDGMDKLVPGEADSLIMAGMGGRLMMDIICRGKEVTPGIREFVLQPQSELPLFRQFLRVNNLMIVEERAVFDGGKYYFPMKAVWGSTENRSLQISDEDYFGPILLKQRSNVFLEYLEKELHTYQGVRERLEATTGDKAQQRLLEVQRDIERIERVLYR